MNALSRWPQSLMREVQRRQVFPKAVDRYVASLTPVQQEVFLHPTRFKTVHAGRRAGKTHLGRVAVLYYASRNPGEFIPIFERSSTCAAARVMWTELRRDNDKWNLGLRFNETLKIVTCPNGAKIGLIGCDKLDETEKARGDKHPFVLVDEAGTFRPRVLLTLYRDVIRPSLVDLRGSLMMVGTPNTSCLGPFHDACQPGSAFTVWTWDMRDNPYIPDAQAEMDAVLLENHWDLLNPTFQREWLGMWVFDGTNLVYKFDPILNLEDPPDDLDCFIMGLDLGWVDDTAIVVLGFNRHKGDKIWVVDAYKRPEMDATDIAEMVHAFAEKYNPDAIVGDTGGLGKTLVQELNRRHGLGIKAAEKTKKNAFIEIMNGDFRKLKLMVATHLLELCTELRTVQWAVLKFKSDVRKIAEGCDDHLSDGLVYAWREACHWIAEPERKKIPPMESIEYEEYMQEQQELQYEERQRELAADVDGLVPESERVWQHELPDPFGESLDD